MQRTRLLLLLAALFSALPGLGAVNSTSASTQQPTNANPAPSATNVAPVVEYVRDPKQGEVIHIRNLAALRPAEAKLRERVAKGLSAVSPYALMQELVAPRDPAVVAQEFLAVHAPAFGIESRDLEVVSRTPDQLGMTHLRFRQLCQGVPVYGVDVVAHVGRNNEVTSVHGRPALVTGVGTLPQLTPAQAETIALMAWQAEHRQNEPAPTKVYGLYVFAPKALGLPEGTNSKPALVWAVDVVPDCCGRELLANRLLVDAETGVIRHEIELHAADQPLYRKVYDCSRYPVDGSCWSNHETSPGQTWYPYVFGRREGMPPRGPNPTPAFLGATDVDQLYDRLDEVDSYYWDKFGRDGANMQGGVKESPAGETWALALTDANPANAGVCPTAAFFYGSRNLEFCLGTATPDVVGHEYAHAVNFYSHNPNGPMVRTGESCALDESQADFFGEMLERYVTGGADWFHGTGASVHGRNMRDPANHPIAPRYGISGMYPDRNYSQNYYCEGTPSYKSGYINLTVMNKAEYLLTEGGTFNGCTITGIGADKAEQLMYCAHTLHYTLNETFNMAYESILAACAELYSPADCEQVKRALQAVELDQAGRCSGQPPRPPQALDVEGW